MYEMYPTTWAREDDRPRREASERPRRRARHDHPVEPQIIRVRQLGRSTDH